MTEKKKSDKELDLLYGAQPVSEEGTEAEAQQREAAEAQHEILVENVEAHRCPYHGQSLQIKTEKRNVKKLDKEGRETNDYKEITVRYAVCTCTVPGEANPYRGKRVWEKT